MKPWMDDIDIRQIETMLLSLNKKHLSILEWGSGGSTVYFTEFLTSNGIKYDWISLEYNKKWYNTIVQKNVPNVDIKLFDVGNNNLKQRHTNMDAYVDYPLSLNKRFDFILVDGRKRRRCIINASNLLNPSGVVLLHDAQRKYYHCAFDNFKISKFLSKTLWCGSNG